MRFAVLFWLSISTLLSQITIPPGSVTSGGTGTTTAFTAGSIVFASTNGVYSQDNSHFFYNSTTHTFQLAGNETITGGASLNTSLLDVLAANNSAYGIRVGNATYNSNIAHGFAIYQENNGVSYFYNNLTSAMSFDTSGNVSVATHLLNTGIPTSGGSGGIYVCVDNTGLFYKKSSCP